LYQIIAIKTAEFRKDLNIADLGRLSTRKRSEYVLRNVTEMLVKLVTPKPIGEVVSVAFDLLLGELIVK